MTWGTEELKEYVDRAIAALEATQERDSKDAEVYRATVQRSFEDLQSRWSARFNELEVRHSGELVELRKSLGALAIRVAVGAGVIATLAFVVPLILNRMG